ncbi:MAG TPA: helix-turn-helix domain-containing protein [Bdellovibrionota bacterium]|nr:helix-turn-helix domain-containing protein [Bdellovibrionota bacterium]
MRRKPTPFDYAVTISRRHRFLVVSVPEFGIHCVADALHLGRISPEAIGQAVLKAIESVERKLLELERGGIEPPRPLISRLSKREWLTTGEAARLSGIPAAEIREMAASGRMPYRRTTGGQIRVSLEAAAEMVAKIGA